MTTDPRDLVGRARIRVYAGCDPTHLMAEGEVVAYCDRPTLFLRHDDGTQTAWSVDLPREIVTPVDYRGCPCGPLPMADGYVHGCPVHDPNPPKGIDR